jgi:hypothetical protein
MPFARVGKDKKVIRTIIKKKDSNTIYKVKGSVINEMYLLKDIRKLEEILLKYIITERGTIKNQITLSNDKYYYVWGEDEYIKKFVDSISSSEIDRLISTIGLAKSFQMYKTFTKKKTDHDKMETEEGLKDFFTHILLGNFTVVDSIDIKEIKIEVVHLKCKNIKLYYIDSIPYNEDGTLYII